MQLIDIIKNARRRMAFDRLRAGAAHPMLSVWDASEIQKDSTRRKVRAIPYFIGKNAPTVLVCPGGAYAFVSYINEGHEIACALNERGFNVLILRYRTGAAAHRAPEDVCAAIKFLIRNSERYQLNTEQLFLCGFSAGGHLTAYYCATQREPALLPQGLLLGYPVISMESETHALSRKLFLGEKEHDTAAQHAASINRIAGAKFPPTFVFHCTDDHSVPVSNSRRIAARLKEQAVPCLYQEYPQGGHGIGLGKNTSADGWMDSAADFLQSILAGDGIPSY